MPSPERPLSVFGSAEYDAALATKVRVNRALQHARLEMAGEEVHEIHPVKTGDDPVGPANRIVLQLNVAKQATAFWSRFQRSATS